MLSFVVQVTGSKLHQTDQQLSSWFPKINVSLRKINGFSDTSRFFSHCYCQISILFTIGKAECASKIAIHINQP